MSDADRERLLQAFEQVREAAAAARADYAAGRPVPLLSEAEVNALRHEFELLLAKFAPQPDE